MHAFLHQSWMPATYLAVVCIAVVGLLLLPAWGHATPAKSARWLTLSGACNGTYAVIVDPPGPGPTGFRTITGKLGVGRLLQAVYAPTGKVASQQRYGTALEHANHDRVICEFRLPPELSRDGTDHWIFRIIGVFR